VIIKYTRRALRDLETIEDYLRQRSPRGMARIGRRIRERIDALALFPLQGKVGAPSMRELVVSQTPHIVIYRVTEQVEIVAILHHARKRRS